MAVFVDVWGEPYHTGDAGATAEAGSALAAPPPHLTGAPVIPLPEPDPRERAAGWPPFLLAFLIDFPHCRGCGRRARTGHHVKPFGMFPELELVRGNVAPVCVPCHFVICHAGNWRTYVVNCLVRLDAHRRSVTAARLID